MDNYAYQPEDNGKPFAIARYPSVPRPANDYLVEVNSRSKFFKKSKFFKILSIILIVLVLLLLIIVIVLSVLYCTEFYNKQLCTSEECLRSAANLRLSVDFSINPCDDFYKYSCGRWSEQHPNHGWFPSFSTFATISEKVLIDTENFLTSDEDSEEPFSVKQARNFYKSCMDIESIDSLGLSVVYKYLRQVDLPIVPSLFTKTNEEIDVFKFDWLKTEVLIKKTFATDVLIGFGIDRNLYNHTENVMYIGVPAYRCPLPGPLKRDNQNLAKQELEMEDLRKTTNANIIRFVLTQIIKNVTSEEPKQDILEHATEVLLNITYRVDELVANYTKDDDSVTSQNIRELQTKINEFFVASTNKGYPGIWEKYLTHLFENTSVTVDFDNDLFYYSLDDFEYLPKILGYVTTTSDIYMELYLWWVTVFAMIINTSSDVVDYILKQTAPFYVGNSVIRSRSLDCSSLVNTFMGMAVSYGLADRAFTNNTKPKVERMLYDIKTAFVDQVNNINWMDAETKQATLEKSKEMVSFIGYPEWLFQKGALDTYYQGIVINNDTYLENMMSIVKIYVPSKLEDLRKYNDRNWSTEPTTVNAYNSFPDNAINLPMVILSFPIYHLGLEVLNYGAIGSVLGHELIHGFDNTGRKLDKFGNYKQWWTNKTIETFEEKIDCFVKQYDNFTVSGVEKHVQGKKTLGENLADNGGVRLAHRAYHNYLKQREEKRLPGFQNFTHDQLFFLAYASIWCETTTPSDLEDQIEYDEHSPNSVRVVGSLQNMYEFATAYNCPVGSNMNPSEKKCKVW